jgi:predicted DNA-binding WGR domain protein
MTRFSAMSMEPNLFWEACQTRQRGRIGTTDQVTALPFEQDEDAVDLLLGLLRRKRHLGYRTVDAVLWQEPPDAAAAGKGACEERGTDLRLCEDGLSVV